MLKQRRIWGIITTLFLILVLIWILMCPGCPTKEYKCEGHIEVSINESSNSNESKEFVQVPYVCGQLILHKNAKYYEKWKRYLKCIGFKLKNTCVCSPDVELWEHQQPLNPIGVVEDAVSQSANPIGGGWKKIPDFQDKPIPNFKITFLPVSRIKRADQFLDTPNYIKSFSCKATKTVKIAIVDSGIDTTSRENGNQLFNMNWELADLNTNCSAIPGNIKFGANIVNLNTEPVDSLGHGTHVTGIVAFDSLVPFEFLHIKFIEKDTGTLFDGLCGLHLALQEGADIINVSWGYLANYLTKNDKPFPIREFLDTADSLGVLICAGMGNGDEDNVGIKLGKSIRFWPASFAQEFSNVISVGAIIGNGNISLADFSNWADDDQMTVATPGVDIVSTFPKNINSSFGSSSPLSGWAMMSGTSMSTPKVVAAAGILKGMNPALTPNKIKNQIILLADDATDGGIGIKILMSNKAIVESACDEISK